MPRAARSKKRREGAGGVPTDSFSDIAFLLIIFFMVATTLMKTRGFQTELPSGKEDSTATEKDNNPTIVLSGDIIMWDQDQVDLESLRNRLFKLELLKLPEDKRIIKLEAHTNVVYGKYFPVWAAIVKAGGVVAIVEGEE